MLEALPVAVRFCCPSCGAGMHGSGADAGSVTNCRRCGEAIRVPRRRHPFECDTADAPNLTPLTLARTRQGVKLLALGHKLVVAQCALVVAGYLLWSTLEGGARVFERDPGGWRNLFAALWVLDLLLVAIQSGVKWLGYQRCEAAGVAVDAAPWVTVTRFAVLLRGVGYLLASLPWLMAATPDAASWLVRAFTQIGHVAWMTGLLFEFGILFVWHRLLSELGGPAAARPVSRFVTWSIGVVLTASAAVSLTGMTLMILLRRQTPTAPNPHPAHLDFAAIPAEGWQTVAALVALLASFSLILAWQYRGLLRVLQTALADAGRRP